MVTDDKNVRVEKLTQALLFALLTANEQPYPLPVPVARRVAEMMDDCGVRQTGDVATEITLPGYITEAVREETVEVPVDADPHGIQETPRVGEAPPRPARIAKSRMGVVE